MIMMKPKNSPLQDERKNSSNLSRPDIPVQWKNIKKKTKNSVLLQG